LDPACGSGNFLYLALQTLKGIEHRVNIEAEALGLLRQNPAVGPEAVLGIELNSYAAELARVTVWVGEIQWMLDHGYSLSKDPILKPLDNIEQRDAIINEDGTEPDWPNVDVIVGNPPFLGGKKMREGLGDHYVELVRRTFKDRLPAFSDLVCYWFEKSYEHLKEGKAIRCGLVSTNSIRGGANRTVLDKIATDFSIFNAWSDEPWVNEGADVRVSLVCFGPKPKLDIILDGNPVDEIYSDLSGATESNSVNLTKIGLLSENSGVSFIGTQKSGAFDVPGSIARGWLTLPNPHGKPNSDLLMPWTNGSAITRRDPGKWVIYFDEGIEEKEAALYEEPYKYIQSNVRDELLRKIDLNKTKGKSTKDYQAQLDQWWRHWRPRPEMRQKLLGLSRYIVVPRVSKYLLFVWRYTITLADSAVVAIGRDDDVAFGILHSHFHYLWVTRTCTWLGVGNDPRYTPTTTFETFPFPGGLSPNINPDDYDNPHALAIAKCARRLVELRDNWLNPSEWIDHVPEVVAGYPDRIVPKKDHEAELKKRTLTNLYNERPTWLDNAHRDLDGAVAAAYGWPANLDNNEILKRLLEQNLKRAEGKSDNK
jgi:type II restriction/modification system DNA methylase subunit YeeA